MFNIFCNFLFQRDDALENLSEILGLGPVSDDGFDQHTILLDYVYDTLMHAISRGFPWDQACTVFTLAYSMISLSKGKNPTLFIMHRSDLICTGPFCTVQAVYN